jgi:RNA recognition motif-containing protein
VPHPSHAASAASSSFKTIEDSLYVGNLSFSTTGEDVRQFLTRAGRKVEKASVVTNYKSGRSRGFAFVRMASVEEADAALELDGTELGGRPVAIAKGRQPTLRRR